MKKYELESLIKSFVLFFLLMSALYFLVATLNYRDRQRHLEDRILNEMRLYSFHPVGDRFDVDFETKEEHKDLMHLYKGESGVFAYFEIPGSQKYLLKLSLPLSNYQAMLDQIRRESFAGWELYLLVIAAISFLLALYTLYPLKRALELNEEFVRDVLHDLNTPLSSLRINLNILQKRYGEDRTMKRMFGALGTIHAFQSNLRAFLSRQEGQMERCSLRELLQERLEFFRALYPGLSFELNLAKDLSLECNREAFLRIIENLLSNAGKYNRPNGKVIVSLEGKLLKISDTGKGMAHPERAFQRYYKEGERGLGLGLHIVKKLADEMGIPLRLQSEVDQGTEVVLDLSGIAHSSKGNEDSASEETEG
ncbi:sensor histidine kinase [Nitratifractor salsuginis]|uniref:histidine kinase n=1 Tax=Nitratifractor salsuginis (strain DSM 16511 / JCM 12458 / E9I37-1) TaxID=749222 RepID=E6X0P3_NITSE|nr:HAMP domain-containing sensor histidine kinase [Nitratifractor salsuginis]ADV45763.1 integral membrane sensor signal transduction histidine kinase [Nitratifractor salsuginis DSM 16511]